MGSVGSRAIALAMLGSMILLSASWVSGASPRRGSPATTNEARPNIVVIMTDDQTSASLDVMRHVKALLGRRGVTFTNSFASYPLCCPSRATFNTGQYAHNHDVTYNDGPTGGFDAFHGRRRVVAAALQRSGYETIHIGKYLNGYGFGDPTYVPPGWSDWLGSVDPSTYRYYGFTLNENGTLHSYGDHEYQTTVYTDLAVKRIEREAERPGPFFLELAYLAPHAVERESSGLDPADLEAAGMPHSRSGIRFAVPAPRDTGHFAHEPLPGRAAFDEPDVTDKPPNIRIRSRFTPAEVSDIKRSYRLRLETLLAVDRNVARIIHSLQATDQLEHTVVVFTSDNGFFHGEHRIPFGKYLPYEPSIRVPLVIRGPGVAEDATSGALVSNVDLPVTILRLAGARAPRRLDGRSLVPVLADPSDSRVHDAVLVESGHNPIGAPVYHGIRTRRYLYVEYDDGFVELYDLRRDPLQLRNRAAAPSHRRIVRRLARLLHEAAACAGRTCP